jgi:multidrug efflux pump subunit AcrA (membrane-fusion protein)
MSEQTERQLLYETRSEDVQEIMGRIPSWLLRYGILVVGGILVLLIVGAHFIKYPDKVNAHVVIVSDTPPVTIISEKSGRIKTINVKQNDNVKKGTVLLVINDPASYEEVLELRKFLEDALYGKSEKKIDIKNRSNLGDLQTTYDEMQLALEDLQFSRKNRIDHGRGVQSPNNSDQQLERTYNANNNSEVTKSSIYSLNREATSIMKRLLQMTINWERLNVITSPIAGRVNLYNIWSENQYLRNGQNIMTIVPVIESVVAKGNIPITNSAKLKVGQSILINLNRFPQSEYGYIEGKITFVASVAFDNTYSFDITLTNGLHTSINRVITPQPEMTGVGEILIDDKTQLARVIESFKR